MKMKSQHLNIFIISILILSSLLGKTSFADQADAAKGVLKRLLPAVEDQFVMELIAKEKDLDVFEIESKGGTIIIRGSSGTAITSGLNWYLKYYCNAHVSWCGDQLNLPNPLPKVEQTIRIVSPYKYRNYLSQCTHSDTMAYWDWDRWEREIDWMALNGINLPMMTTGLEAVWQNTLRKFKMSDDEIRKFLAGPNFLPWLYFNNLESWGGPLPQNWIDKQAKLQKKIYTRMRSLGISPMLQTFYGSVVPFVYFVRVENIELRRSGAHDWFA